MKNKALQNSEILSQVAKLSWNQKPALISLWEKVRLISGKQTLEKWNRSYNGYTPDILSGWGLAACTLTLLLVLVNWMDWNEFSIEHKRCMVIYTSFFTITIGYFIILKCINLWERSKISSEENEALMSLDSGLRTILAKLDLSIEVLLSLSETDLKNGVQQFLRSQCEQILKCEVYADTLGVMSGKSKLKKIYTAFEDLGLVSGGYAQFFRK